jgi:hypothetical protein
MLIFQRNLLIFNLPIKRYLNNKPLPHFSKTHYSLAQTWHARPELHRLCFGNFTAKTRYSRQLAPGQANIPLFQHSNWGEAPKFDKRA